MQNNNKKSKTEIEMCSLRRLHVIQINMYKSEIEKIQEITYREMQSI